jgi:hypothetical protein
MNDFFELNEVKTQQNIQKVNPPGSVNHRNAHIELIKIATEYSVNEFFGTISDYDEEMS